MDRMLLYLSIYSCAFGFSFWYYGAFAHVWLDLDRICKIDIDPWILYLYIMIARRGETRPIAIFTFPSRDVPERDSLWRFQPHACQCSLCLSCLWLSRDWSLRLFVVICGHTIFFTAISCTSSVRPNRIKWIVLPSTPTYRCPWQGWAPSRQWHSSGPLSP